MSIWVHEEIFFDGDSYFDALETKISRAKETIELETYIWTDDPIGWRIAEALMRAAKRGIRVRTVVDGLGSYGWDSVFLKPLQAAGVQARIYHPLPWQMSSFTWIIHVISRMNRRDHRKVAIIDGKIAFAGGMNISAVHSKKYSGAKAWRDTSVCVQGKDIAAIKYAFIKAWIRSWDFTSRKPLWFNLKRVRELKAESRLVRLNHTIVLRRRMYRDLLRRIRQASSRIWITTAYFVPDGSLVRRLRKAARRGVDVRILVSRSSDIFFMRWVTSGFYYAVLRAGVRVYEYRPRILHAKTIEIDDWAVVGSSNLNHRSLFHDLEIDIELSGSHEKAVLSSQFEKDLENSSEIRISHWRQMPWVEKILGQIFLVAKYWF